MTFDEVLAQVLELLQRQGRVSYGALKRRFDLDDTYLDDLKTELIDAQRLALDEGGRILVWRGAAGAPPQPLVPSQQGPGLAAGLVAPEAERRQLTVMVCDLVDSTALASQLDPEELLAVIHAYQATCAQVIQRFAGQIAQYLGDGLLIYFGYPQAHDDDAQRAVRAGVGIVEAMDTLNRRLAQEQGVRLALRVGIHTGLVVVGTMGGEDRSEQLALGDTPHIAARLQALAASNTVVMSETTARLVHGYFVCQPLGMQGLTGFAQPLRVYCVLRESEAHSREDVAYPHALPPLVGREQEVHLLLERWTRVKEGLGQVIFVSGEAGIGKSRLVQVLKDHVASEPHTRWECRGSPYHQNTAFYPLIDLWQRALHFHRDEAPEEQVTKLEHALSQYHAALHETVPLLATFLSLPIPAERYQPLPLTPQRQKQRTLEMLLAFALERAAEHPVVLIIEDLHWVDPSTLEFLTLLLDQGPTAAIFTILTCRPEFQPPWGLRTHLTPLALHRLPPAQVRVLIEQVTGGKPLPPEVTEQVVAKTDGVPLFVEELTKMVLESGLLREAEGHYALMGPLPPLAIPTTLHDSLTARLDRLAAVKVVAQLGATLGRTFAYDLLQAVAPLEEGILQHGLQQLVEAELLYQRGVPPQATYLFKHALIQEAAYQSLLRSTRQQYHQRIAQVLEAQFPEIVETQPEVLAHHCTEAGLGALAVDYWQRAGQRALQRSAYMEAINHCTMALELLATLPDTPERRRQELDVHTALGPALIATKGYAAPDVERAYTRARELGQQVGETPQLFPVLWGLWLFYLVRASALQTTRALAFQLLEMAQRHADPALLLEAHMACGLSLYHCGEPAAALTHLEAGRTLYDPQQHQAHTFFYSQDPGVACLTYGGVALWLLGYPDQALARIHEALALAQMLLHPFNIAFAHFFASVLHQLRHEPHPTQGQAEALLTLAAQHDFAYWRAQGTILHGWALAAQGQGEAGLAQLRQGLALHQAIGSAIAHTCWLGLLADGYRTGGQPAAGLAAVAEAVALGERSGEQFYTAELHRLRGELLLQAGAWESESGGCTPLSAAWHPHAAEAEDCFQQALGLARQQHAKALELRAVTSLSRLWQRQGKTAAALQTLREVYGWFTEGFDTADLQAAKTVLEALA